MACMNCRILLLGQQEQEYFAINLSPDLVDIAEEWCGREININDQLCEQCLNLVISESCNRNEHPNANPHPCVCISCGISLAMRSGRRRHRLTPGSTEAIHIENLIFPRQVPNEAWICHGCWMRLYVNVRRHGVPQGEVHHPEALNVPGPRGVEEPQLQIDGEESRPTSESNSWAEEIPHGEAEHLIYLSNYSRTPDTANHCFVPECTNAERLRVPKYLKRAILTQHQLYITPSARICRDHVSLFNWELLNEHTFLHTFNETQIEAMFHLLSSAPARSMLNFEDILNINDNICHYWTGLTVIRFMALFNSVPPLQRVARKAKTALGLYLVKIRTGESIARIATLFMLAKGTVSLYINRTRTCLTRFYVPSHLGINHMTRANHSARNLTVPQGLFGTENQNPIVICDGTYIYLQKSTNYLFQKKTYSLHKYRNLVKPFLMVSCDGHIIDAFGPYAATKSDAAIMLDLFNNPDSPLRSYFREGDIFILDRGFRDAIPLLTSLGYSVHKPESLGVGESQLSTTKANKSRTVTMCRWVVEVVNGRFKRDFKIFRQNYFNIYSRNLMPDFRIVAAILNHFHPVITDHPDAQAILERALSRREMPNDLANLVIDQRFNRQSAHFVNIDGQLPQLNVFPVMDMRDLILFGLGIYQIKQAKSYYGEHIRENGTFFVEVGSNLQHLSDNELLLRGRIRSRHTSNRKYFTYILLDSSAEDWTERIAGYYCSCIIGKRTVGSCAHLMTIVWYLGWARYQDVPVMPPASFLDGILVRDDIENE